MNLSIIISTWNSLKFLKPCLESLAKLDLPEHEIIIIDSPSKDGTEKYLDNLASSQDKLKLKVLYLDRKLDWSDANKIGLDASTGDWICLCNPDILFNESFLNMLDSCEKNQIEVAAPQLVFPDGRLQPARNVITPKYFLTGGTVGFFVWHRLLRRKIPSFVASGLIVQ